jgi:hypothetical protein
LLIVISELDNPAALTKFFNLLLSVLRIINAVVLSRGQQNEQTIAEARRFLVDYRPSIVSIFKRNAGIGVQGNEQEIEVLNEIVDQFTLLITFSEYLEVSGFYSETNLVIMLTCESSTKIKVCRRRHGPEFSHKREHSYH